MSKVAPQKGQAFQAIAGHCRFPARALVTFRARLLRETGTLPAKESSPRIEAIKTALRAIDHLAKSHEALHGCACFEIQRRARVQVEDLRRQRREAERRDYGR
jgi:hypothetical protein